MGKRMTHGSHDHGDDPRNAGILISVNGEMLPRDKAVVSVLDSGGMPGDGVRILHWYGAVERSTGFGPPPAPELPSLPGPLRRIADAARPFHEETRRCRLPGGGMKATDSDAAAT